MPTKTEPRRVAGASTVTEQRDLALDAAGARLIRRATGADEPTSPPTFVGHAAVFDSRTTIGDPLRWGWYESIARSAFDKTLSEGDARFLIDHASQLLVARKSAGDLRLSTDAVGLAVEAELDQELSYVRDLTRNLDAGRITGMSFGFWVVRDTWTTETVTVELDGEERDFEVDVRVIDEVRLLEVSAVTFPAYEDTDAGVRSMADSVREARGVSREPNLRPASAPATRDEQDPNAEQDPAPVNATRGKRLDERAQALAVRYRLPARAAGGSPTDE